MINVGFIGLGGMGFGQAKAFAQAKTCKVVAGADIAEPSRARFSKEFPNAKAFADYKDLLADKTVDAVVVATPTLFHKDVVINALKSGRAVLSEKPLARSVADSRKMIEAANKAKKLLMVAHCRRFDNDWGTIAKAVSAGTLGGPILWRHFVGSDWGLNLAPWFLDDKMGGGPLLDGAIHDHDFCNYMFGDPLEVRGSSVKLFKSCTAIDTGTMIIHYKHGNQSMNSWSWVSPGASEFDLLGSKGALQPGPGTLATPELDTKKFGYWRFTEAKTHKVKLLKFTRKDMYVTQAKHFIECIENKIKCLSPATEAIKGVAVFEAFTKATQTGKSQKVVW
jgi:predicted dehydrogenase